MAAEARGRRGGRRGLPGQQQRFRRKRGRHEPGSRRRAHPSALGFAAQARRTWVKKGRGGQRDFGVCDGVLAACTESVAL